MKPDDFEKQLERQPVRSLPTEWRREILQAAHATSPRPATRESRQISWWREWLWPCPQAWAGLAAVWVAIFALNYRSPEYPVATAKERASQASDTLQALHQKREMLRAELAESTGFDALNVIEPFRPRPRSDRAVPTAAV